MTERNDGGPAFPVKAGMAFFAPAETAVEIKGEIERAVEKSHTGMSLRDWFAGQALVGLMSDEGMRPSNTEEFSHMAMRLYQVADAMLAQRTNP